MTEKTYLKKQAKYEKKFNFYMGLYERIRDEKMGKTRNETEQCLWMEIGLWVWNKADKWLKKQYDLFGRFRLGMNKN